MIVSTSHPRRTVATTTLVLASLAAGFVGATEAAPEESLLHKDAPVSADPRLVVSLFAAEPLVVTPTGLAVDDRGRVFVAESHTHFRPEGYTGPPADRILRLDDTDGDGRADRHVVFHAGFTHVMDLAFHPDGSLYVATRGAIRRLRDLDEDGRADEVRTVVELETTGNYPHNGLSGLAFDFSGGLHFGLGENLGHAYGLVGTDGTRLEGGGEGGSTYHVGSHGRNLRRVSTGWWNPFGLGVDAFGRVWGTDNDPSSSPPCRLHQVVEAADFGYEYRYGRSGLHPLVTWTGDLPGTLPMVAGTGEAPCAVIAYESDALPQEYRGKLFVASWADRQIEHFAMEDRSHVASPLARRGILCKSEGEFRPVDLSVAPDGTVYVSDWVSSSYKLHGKGRVWRIRPKNLAERVQPAPVSDEVAREALFSGDRRRRERAARELVRSQAGKDFLRRQLATHSDPRVQAVCIQAMDAAKVRADYTAVVAREASTLPVRALALSAYLRRGGDPRPFASAATPAPLRATAIPYLGWERDRALLEGAIASLDPHVFHAAIYALLTGTVSANRPLLEGTRRQILAATLAAKRNPELRADFAQEFLGSLLESEDPMLRLTAVKWVADDRLVSYRSKLVALLSAEWLDVPAYLAITAAIDRLDGKKPSDRPSTETLVRSITASATPASIRRAALRLVGRGIVEPVLTGNGTLAVSPSGLTVHFLAALAAEAETAVAVEAVRTLGGLADSERIDALIELAIDKSLEENPRAAAVAALASSAEEHLWRLVKLAEDPSLIVRDAALRALVGTELSASLSARLDALAQKDAGAVEAVRRILEGGVGPRPAANDIASWSELLEGPSSARAGELVFFSTKVGNCAACHQVEGRGARVGPDLTQIHRRLATTSQASAKREVLAALLDPSRAVAPEYTAWTLVTADGKQHTGLALRKGGSKEVYLGIDGNEFTLLKDDIVHRAEAERSFMPEGLLQVLTVQELRDLLAFVHKG